MQKRNTNERRCLRNRGLFKPIYYMLTQSHFAAVLGSGAFSYTLAIPTHLSLAPAFQQFPIQARELKELVCDRCRCLGPGGVNFQLLALVLSFPVHRCQVSNRLGSSTLAQRMLKQNQHVIDICQSSDITSSTARSLVLFNTTTNTGHGMAIPV